MSKHRDVLVYAKASKIIHWLIAAIVLLMLSLSFFLENLSDADKPMGYMLHKSFGLIVLSLMIVRVFWIHQRGRPPLPATVPGWERIFSCVVQYGFYLFLLLMPLSGWILSTAANHIPQFFGLFAVPFPGILPNEVLAATMDKLHKIIAWTLIVLVFFHVSGALKHHFWDRDDVLKRMLFK